MVAVGFDSAVTFFAFWIFVGFNDSICNLHKQWFQAGPSVGNASGFHFPAALVIAWTAVNPGDEVLCCRENRHVDSNFGNHSNCRHRVSRETGNSTNQIQLPGVGLGKAKDCFLNIFLVGLQFINVLQEFLEFSGLFMGDGFFTSGLDFLYGMLAASVYKGHNIKGLAGMLQDIADDGT